MESPAGEYPIQQAEGSVVISKVWEYVHSSDKS